MSQLLPSKVENTLSDAVIHIDPTGYEAGPDATIKSTVVDSGASPTTTIRKGCVIVKESGDNLYYLADDTNDGAHGDRDLPPSIPALEAADTDWDGTTVAIIDEGGVTQTVTFAGSDDTNAECIAAINAQTDGILADESGGLIRVRTTQGGAHKHLSVTSSLATAFGAAAVTARGSDAEYLVTEEEISMVDPHSLAVANRPVRTSRKAFYDESELKHTTVEALAALRRNGSRFG